MKSVLEREPAVARTDGEILEDVLREFAWDTRIDERDFDVRVREGVVTLTGEADSLSRKLAAVRAAHRVRGVLDVVDEIEVRPSHPLGTTDADLARAVRHALEWDVFVDDKKIRSTVSEGVVVLEGEVDYITEREDAARAVRDLKGVRSVLNRIHVRPAAAATDTARLHRAIAEALERRAEREAERIEVQLRDGEATLTGRVHSWQERASIVGTVSHAPGVRSVCDLLRVDPSF